MKELDQVRQIIDSMLANSTTGAMKISSTVLLNKISIIEKELEKERAIEEALQQMTGFRIGKWGANIIELVSSMGLKKEEWEDIKKYEDNGNLDKRDIEEINEYFNNKKGALE